MRMNTHDPLQNKFLAELLTHTAPELADRAAASLLARYPIAARRYGEDSLGKWRDSLRGRVLDLAAAVNAGDAAMFAEQIGWARVGVLSRAVPIEDLRQALLALLDTLESELPAEDRALAAGYVLSGLRAVDAPSVEEERPLAVDTPAGALAGRYLLALLEGDRRTAAAIVLDSVRDGHLAASDAYLNVLAPVLRELGRMWHMNEITIAEEHFATATTTHVMSQVAPLLPRTAPHGRSALICAVAGNRHEIGARIIADFLEADGWRAVYLGGDTPAHEIAAAVATFRADLVALSAMLRTHLRAAEDTIALIKAASPATPVIVGGPAFAGHDSLWRDVGADGAAHSPPEALALARALVPIRTNS